jgi:hypothetical protein
VASVILRNGSVPLKGKDDATEWIQSFSGTNTRWETIGIMFVAFAYVILSLPDKDIRAVFQERAKERSVLVAEMKGCIEACIELCRSLLNTLVCNL